LNAETLKTLQQLCRIIIKFFQTIFGGLWDILLREAFLSLVDILILPHTVFGLLWDALLIETLIFGINILFMSFLTVLPILSGLKANSLITKVAASKILIGFIAVGFRVV